MQFYRPSINSTGNKIQTGGKICVDNQEGTALSFIL
jgi:hypothetical protein